MNQSIPLLNQDDGGEQGHLQSDREKRPEVRPSLWDNAQSYTLTELRWFSPVSRGKRTLQSFPTVSH